MSILLARGTSTHQGVGLTATSNTPLRGLPQTFPLSATWACYPLTAMANDYHTLFGFGPASFSGADYYTCAIVIGGGSNPLWSFGINGSDNTNGGTTEIVERDRWYYQGFRIIKEATQFTAYFYYDLPDKTKVIHFEDLLFTNLGPNYFATAGSTTFFRWGDVAWADETFNGNIASIKMWQDYLGENELAAEAMSPWPVIPRFTHTLWDVIPLRTTLDKNYKGIKKRNGRPWLHPGDLPVTSGLTPRQWNASRWYWQDRFDPGHYIAPPATNIKDIIGMGVVPRKR